MLKQALPIDEDLEIDESRPASTAEEYLLQVRNERRKLPSVTYAPRDKIDKNIKNGGQKQKMSHYAKYFEASCFADDANPALLPNDEWRQQFANSFNSKRDILINELVDSDKWGKAKKDLRDCDYSKYRSLQMPHHSHRNKWIKFAMNLEKFQNLLAPPSSAATKIFRNADGVYAEVECKDGSEFAVPPLLTIMERLSPIETERLLQFFMQFVMECEGGLNGMACMWLNALFMRIEKPLMPQLAANIREFARFCIKRRNELDGNQEASAVIALCNLFIVIVEDVFKQPIK